jgi:hypothetical protein
LEIITRSRSSHRYSGNPPRTPAPPRWPVGCAANPNTVVKRSWWRSGDLDSRGARERACPYRRQPGDDQAVLAAVAVGHGAQGVRHARQALGV